MHVSKSIDYITEKDFQNQYGSGGVFPQNDTMANRNDAKRNDGVVTLILYVWGTPE
jgi:hypothetical protein